jgi:hypothetical protein
MSPAVIDSRAGLLMNEDVSDLDANFITEIHMIVV